MCYIKLLKSSIMEKETNYGKVKIMEWIALKEREKKPQRKKQVNKVFKNFLVSGTKALTVLHSITYLCFKGRDEFELSCIILCYKDNIAYFVFILLLIALTLKRNWFIRTCIEQNILRRFTGNSNSMGKFNFISEENSCDFHINMFPIIY